MLTQEIQRQRQDESRPVEEEYLGLCQSYSGDSLLQALIITAQSGLWDRHASVEPPVPLTVTAPRGGGVRPLEQLFPHCIISVGGRARAHVRPEPIQLSRLHLGGNPAAFLFLVYNESF